MKAEDIEQYINRFHVNVREKVFEEITKGKFLKTAFEKPELKAILDNAIEQYGNLLLGMVEVAVSGDKPECKAEKIIALGNKAEMLKIILAGWVGDMKKSESHEEKINSKTK